MCPPLAACWFLMVAVAVPPLGDAQLAQLGSAIDGNGANDEGALYPLLDNALRWQVGDEIGAQIPDYAALRARPEAGRGNRLFLIEGTFARSRPITLARPGPWGEAVTEWVVQVRTKPEQEEAVVYFVEPANSMPTPRPGDSVRITARFYKIWADLDQDHNPTTYLLFVARSAKVTNARSDTSVAPTQLLLVVLVLVALLYLFWRLRKISTKPRPLERQRRHATSPPTDTPPDAPTDDQPPDLPADPAEAMEQLQQLHEPDESEIKN